MSATQLFKHSSVASINLKISSIFYNHCVRTFCGDNSKDGSERVSPLKHSIQDVEKLLQQSTPLKDNIKDDSTFATSSYSDGTVFSKYSQASRSLRPSRDPTTTSVILFPGQGSQFVGMGQNLLKYSIAREMFDTASAILGYDLLKVCTEGPIEKLSQTVYCQPAVVVCSLAAVEKLKEEKPEAINNCIATAGFSVGEISALVFAGCFNFERAVKIVKARAEAMQLCSEMTPGGMLTVLLGPDSLVTQACTEAKEHCLSLGIKDPVCATANYLYPAAKVLAGNSEALDFIVANASKFKIRRTSRLPVSGAFHTALMEPAAEAVYAALKKGFVNDPIISVHRNIDGKRYHNGAAVVHSLPRQLHMPVKWEQILHVLYERPGEQDFPKTFECGPGKSLITLLRKVNAKAAHSAYNVVP